MTPHARRIEAGIIQLTKALRSLFKDTAEQLSGTTRQQFMAKVVQGLGAGGQTPAEQQLGWNWGTIRKGIQELTSGIAIADHYQNSRYSRLTGTACFCQERVRAN